MQEAAGSLLLFYEAVPFMRQEAPETPGPGEDSQEQPPFAEGFALCFRCYQGAGLGNGNMS